MLRLVVASPAAPGNNWKRNCGVRLSPGEIICLQGDMPKKLIIQPENPADFKEIYKVNQLAFGRKNESELISVLRGKSSFDPRLSLMALINKNCVGYSLLFPITSKILALGPVAVMPDYQRQKIGT